MDPSAQLPLDLANDAASGRDDLIVTPANRQALAHLDSWPDWPAPIAVLAGPVGAGKTHLSAIWSQQAGAQFVAMNDDFSQQLEQPSNIVVEDVSAEDLDETWMFHLINTVRANNGSLLITSRVWPGQWRVQLPDLQSRLKLAQLIELHEPDDALLGGVLSKLFSDRQIQVEPPVVNYLVLRMERSLACAQGLVEALDELSMSHKRAITKPLAAIALQQMGLQQ